MPRRHRVDKVQDSFRKICSYLQPMLANVLERPLPNKMLNIRPLQKVRRPRLERDAPRVRHDTPAISQNANFDVEVARWLPIRRQIELDGIAVRSEKFVVLVEKLRFRPAHALGEVRGGARFPPVGLDAVEAVEEVG